MSRLPLRTPLTAGEGWHSYLIRSAAAHGVTVAALADHVGLRRAGRWPGYHGITLEPEHTRHVAQALNLYPPDVEAMQLDSYDQRAFDLTGLTRPVTPPAQGGHLGSHPASEGAGVGRSPTRIGSTRRVVHQGWVFLAGSRYCPLCLARDGVWHLPWRIPWVTTCPEHQVWLEHRCPGCGGTPGLYNALHATAPSRSAAVPDGRRCDLPVPSARGAVCGTDLGAAPTEPAPTAALDSTTRTICCIATDTGVVAGQSYTSLDTLRAWQATIGIAISLGHAAVPTPVRDHRWGAPPRDPHLLQHLLDAAQPVIEAPNPSGAADILEHWCDAAGITSPHRDTFNRATRPTPALREITDVLLGRVGRAHTRLIRQRQADRSSIPVLPWTVEHVPQLVWRCALPASLRDATKPDQRLLRAVVAMTLVRMLHGADWAASGATLGFPTDKARQWTRYCFLSAFPGLKDDLLNAATTLSPLLLAQPAGGLWHDRPPIPWAHGVFSFQGAQAPGCRAEDPDADWCPCTDPKPIP